MPKRPKRAVVAAVKPLVSKRDALKKQWAGHEERIVGLRERGADAFDELWEVVDEVMSSSLYLAGGMRSEAEFIRKMLPGESARSVQRNRLVAVAFSPEDEARLGITLL